MSSLLSVNSLDYTASPKLIFTANTPERKGLAHKSYSIDLPYTTNNNTLLNDIWGAGVLRPVSFEAVYTVGGVNLRGWLKLTEITRTGAKAVFVSGNGYLWERMGQDRLRSIDMSDADIVLNKTNVLASETGTPFVLFDLTDRGAYKQTDGIDITDRFPALRLTELFDRIFNHYGVGLATEGLNGDEYLLFMQESEIRNSDEWKQENYLEAEEETIDYQLNTQAAGAMTWTKKLELTEIEDEGGNYATGTYIIPETGTYRFRASVNKMEFTFEDDQGNPASLSYGGTANRVRVAFQFRKDGTMINELARVETILGGLSVVTDEYELDTLPVEFTAGDEIELYVELTATVSFTGGGTQSRFTASLDTTTETNELSRWYGAGSTIEIENVLPDMGVTEFIKATTEFLNMDVFYDDRLGIVTLRAGDGLPSAIPITAWDIESVIDEPKDTLIEFATDKVLPPPHQYISVTGLGQVTRKLSYSRTYIGRSGRLGIDIPVLWNSGRPTDVDQWLTPPEQKTRGALRILRKSDDVSASYVLTYGGDTTASRETQTTHIAFEELDTYSLHLRDAARVEQYVTAYAKLDLSKLQDLTYFKNTITLQDRFTGERYSIQLLQADQIDGEIFKLTGQVTALYNIFTQDSTRQVADTNTFTGSSGGGGTLTAEPLPADVWQSSVAAQISGLTEKATPVDNDNLVIDDSADGNKKKRVKWSRIKAVLSSTFYGAYAGQFNATSEKTALANADLIIIEDSADTYKKKKATWTNIKSFLKTYFDNIYYGAVSGQFAATTEKTSITANDIFIIEDSAASNAKKSFKYSTLKTALDILYGFWSAVTGGIRTNNRVGINTDPGTGTGVKVVDSNFGVDSKSTGNGAYRAEIEGNADYSFSPVIPCYRTTTSTAAAGIGMIMPFYIQNSAGTTVLAAYTQVKLTNATAGSEKAEYLIYVNSGVRAKVNEDNDFELSSGTDLKFVASGDGVILKSPDGSNFRITVNDAGTLVVTEI